MSTMRKCPYCAEDIAAEAIRCRYCRSRLVTLDPQHWHRHQGERRVAGVAVALARAFATPVSVVRIAFVLLTFFHLLGPLLYGALWLLIPYDPGDESLLERGLGRARDVVATLRGARHPADATAADTRPTDRQGTSAGAAGTVVRGGSS